MGLREFSSLGRRFATLAVMPELQDFSPLPPLTFTKRTLCVCASSQGKAAKVEGFWMFGISLSIYIYTYIYISTTWRKKDHHQEHWERNETKKRRTVRSNVNERRGGVGGVASPPRPLGKRRRAWRQMVVVFVSCWCCCCCCCYFGCLILLALLFDIDVFTIVAVVMVIVVVIVAVAVVVFLLFLFQFICCFIICYCCSFRCVVSWFFETHTHTHFVVL